jgi:hypothetical protein
MRSSHSIPSLRWFPQSYAGLAVLNDELHSKHLSDENFPTNRNTDHFSCIMIAESVVKERKLMNFEFYMYQPAEQAFRNTTALGNE